MYMHCRSKKKKKVHILNGHSMVQLYRYVWSAICYLFVYYLNCQHLFFLPNTHIRQSPTNSKIWYPGEGDLKSNIYILQSFKRVNLLLLFQFNSKNTVFSIKRKIFWCNDSFQLNLKRNSIINIKSLKTFNFGLLRSHTLNPVLLFHGTFNTTFLLKKSWEYYCTILYITGLNIHIPILLKWSTLIYSR